ncbi:phage tail assembly protein [Vibrio scophthalmi]|uniref:Putative tail assembly protein FS-gp41 n=1 Tax=Vibrio scophthalmi TaxID=45658 RepID=A0A1E3WMB6_9VIBR|nr:phage tail assembly protein [Vibrio scophthalmi]ODS10921.1 putative tail assembly protein FS-gp41 [Vibrio scophthalmi]
MAKIEFTIEHGLPFGKGEDKEMQYDVTLRSLTTGDVIDARIAAEKVIFAPDPDSPGITKAITVVSDVMVGLELLRRQIASVGVLQGPLEMSMLRKFHPEDFDLINKRAEMLDQATQVAEKRGRMEESINNA